MLVTAECETVFSSFWHNQCSLTLDSGQCIACANLGWLSRAGGGVSRNEQLGSKM